MKVKILMRNASAVLLGGFFIISGAGKLFDVGQLISTVRIYGIPSYVAPAAILLPPLEIVIGLLVVLPSTRKLASGVVFVVLIIFTGAYGYAHFFRGVEKCGCSGRFYFLDKDFPELLAVNVALSLLSIALFKTSGKHDGTFARWQKASVLTVAVLSLTAAAASSMKPLEWGNSNWVKKNTDSKSFSEIISTNRDSTYALFFYDMDCPHCWEAVKNVKALQSEKVVDKVVGFTFGTDSSLARFESVFHPNFTSYLIPVEKFYTLTNSVPTISFIRDDTIIYRDEDEVKPPSWYEQHVFKKKLTAPF
ncbi:MAG: DoxX family protein [Candidatus Kryptoniota bacterium]